MRVERAGHHVRDPKAFAERAFTRLDRDGSGDISKDEFSEGLSRRTHKNSPEHSGPNLGNVVESFFKSADADGDGKVSQSELEQTLQKVLNPPVSYTRSGGLQTEPHSGCFSATA